MPLVEVTRELIEVRDEDDADIRFVQRADDLGGDLGAFALVRGREGLIAKEERVRVNLSADRAHAPELFVELAARHRGVLLASKVGEDAAHDRSPEGLGGDGHSGLHHELCDAEAAQERRLPALVGAGDDDEGLAMGAQVVADHGLRGVEHKAGLV